MTKRYFFLPLLVLFCLSLYHVDSSVAGGTFARVKTWSTGDVLNASDLNAEFDNLLNNLDPDGIDDASADATAMQATADPYPGGTASLATDIRGEIQRLRYLIYQITGETYWYIDPDTNLSTVSSFIGTKYYPDSSVANHGAASTNSILSILQTIGSTSQAAVVFKRGTTGNSTSYLFTTTADFSAYTNIIFEFHAGTALSVATGLTVTMPSPAQIVAPPDQAIITGAGSVVFNEPGVIHPGWYGFSTLESGANNAAYLSDAINWMAAGSELAINPNSYTLAGQVTISKACKLNGYKSTFTWGSDTTASRGILVTASNVEIYGLELDGPQHASSVTTQTGIYAYGADSSNYLTGIVIEDCKIHDWGYAGIDGLFLEKAKIKNNDVYQNYAKGIMVLSDLYSQIHGNHVWEIIGNGVVSTECYGIMMSKNIGSEATYPASVGTEVHNNHVHDCRTWTGIDSHGGHYLSIIGNEVYDTRLGIALGPYITTAGSESAPVGCIIQGNTVRNNHGAGELITVDDQQLGIFIGGYITSSTFAYNNLIANNAVEGHGYSVVNEYGAIHTYYSSNTTIANNVIKSSGRHGIGIESCPGVLIEGNNIDTLTGTVATAATGTITFALNPSGGDTITVNGRVYTYTDTVTTDFDIEIKGTLELTLDETTRILNLASGDISSPSRTTDGRVSTATYSNDATILTITFDTIGRSGESFTLAASAATVSAANLACVTEMGSSGIYFGNLSGAGAGEYNTGLCANNTISVDAYVGIQTKADITSVDFSNNRNLGTGPLYDLNGSAGGPQSGAGGIDSIGMVSYSYNLYEIAAAGYEVFYIPTPGIGSTPLIQIAANRSFDGLIMSYRADSNYNAVYARFDNPSAAAIDLENTTFYVRYGKYAARQ